MNKLLKLVAVGILVLNAVGCHSIGGVTNKYVSNDNKEGVFYGANLGEGDAGYFCELIKNKDPRCADASKYKTLTVAAKIGFADGFTGMIAFAPKDMETGLKECTSGSDKCTYFKVLVEKNKLGTVLEVASKPNGKALVF